MKTFQNIILQLAFLLIMVSCNAQTNQWTQQHEIIISFELEELKPIDICDDFALDIIGEKRKYGILIEGCNIHLPKIPVNEKNVDVIFKFKEYKLNFENVSLELLFKEQKISWIFSISYPPFDKEKNGSIDKIDLLEIHYLGFAPHESGLGIEIINPIYKEKE